MLKEDLRSLLSYTGACVSQVAVVTEKPPRLALTELKSQPNAR